MADPKDVFADVMSLGFGKLAGWGKKKAPPPPPERIAQVRAMSQLPGLSPTAQTAITNYLNEANSSSAFWTEAGGIYEKRMYDDLVNTMERENPTALLYAGLPPEERKAYDFAQLLSGQTGEEMRAKQATADALVSNLLAQGVPIQEAYQRALDTYGQEVARIAPEMESLGEGPAFEAAYQRSYQPFLQQLDKEMRDRHQDVLERHATRGIAGGTPESYDTALLERERTDTMKRGALEARSQALGEYRSGKAAALDVRGAGLQQLLQNWERTAVPGLEYYGVPQSTRQQIVEGGATSNLGQRLANAAEMHQINAARKAAGQQAIMNLIGGGLGAGGAIGASGVGRGGAFGSAPELKTDIRPEPNDEQALDIFRDADVSRWRYNEEPPGTEHVGTMTTELPDEMLSPDGQGIDIPSYLGRLTQAVKALDKKMGGFESLLRGAA